MKSFVAIFLCLITVLSLFSCHVSDKKADAIESSRGETTATETESNQDQEDRTESSRSEQIPSPTVRYDISEAKAIAARHWNIEDGLEDYATGKKIVFRIVVVDTPHDTKNFYHVVCRYELYHRNDEDQYVLTWVDESYKEMHIDAATGACTDYDTDGKGAGESGKGVAENAK